MAASLDNSPPRNILHPRNKREIGHRLALIARHQVYGQPVDAAGPVYQSSKIEGDKIRIAFNHVGTGLVADASAVANTNSLSLPLKGFAISGTNLR